MHNPGTQISEHRTYTMYCSQKVASFILQMTYEQRYYTTKTHALLSSQTIVGFEDVRCSINVKERKTPQQMIMAGAITGGIVRWDGDRYVSSGMV